MKKIALITIVRNSSDNDVEITPVIFEVNCTTEEEIDIHRAITTTRDPNVFFDILTYNQNPEDIGVIKSHYSPAREKIRQSNTIKVNFLPWEKCQGNCSMCLVHAFYNYDHEVLLSVRDVTAKIEKALMLNPCKN